MKKRYMTPEQLLIRKRRKQREKDMVILGTIVVALLLTILHSIF